MAGAAVAIAVAGVVVEVGVEPVVVVAVAGSDAAVVVPVGFSSLDEHIEVAKMVVEAFFLVQRCRLLLEVKVGA